MDGWMDGWMDGRMDGWMDGWVRGRVGTGGSRLPVEHQLMRGSLGLDHLVLQ
jgi:hypothetical protein